jgi:hypothetical protein
MANEQLQHQHHHHHQQQHSPHVQHQQHIQHTGHTPPHMTRDMDAPGMHGSIVVPVGLNFFCSLQSTKFSFPLIY